MSPINSAPSPSSLSFLLLSVAITAFGGIFHYNNLEKNLDSKIKEPLEKAEEAFKLGCSQQTQQKIITGHLSEAYSELSKRCKANGSLPKHLEQEAAKICYLYGRCIYGGDMQASRQMFQLSLAIQMASSDILTNTFTTSLISCEQLENLPKEFSSNHRAQNELDRVLDANSIEKLSKSLDSQNNDALFLLGTTLRWLGHSCQNIDRYRTDVHADFFEKVYGLAKEIFAKIDTNDSRWEIGEIIYNSGPFVYHLKNPSDIDGGLKILDQTYDFIEAEGNTLRAQQKRAQLYNKKSIALRDKPSLNEKEKAASLKTQFEQISKALEIANSTEGFDPFLTTMFFNNKVNCALECIKAGIEFVTIEEIDTTMQAVLAEIQKEEYNHYYHALYFINAAKIEIVKNNPQGALNYLDMSEAINKKFPESSKDIQASVEKIRLEIKGKAPISK